MAAASTGRQRYQWLLVLVAVVLLVAWFFVDGGQGGTAPDDGGTSTSAPSSDPTHDLTETNTPTTEPSSQPSSQPTKQPTNQPTTTSSSGPRTDPESGLPVIDVASLPAEARDVLDRINSGGPFKYPDNDGVTFENREDLLPDRPMGYYREYTVETAPRVRGPRRIVTGSSGELYWTADHYDSFSRISRVRE